MTKSEKAGLKVATGNFLLLGEWMDLLMALPAREMAKVITAMYMYVECGVEIEMSEVKNPKSAAFLVGALPTLKSRRFGQQGGYYAQKANLDKIPPARKSGAASDKNSTFETDDFFNAAVANSLGVYKNPNESGDE